MRVLVADTFEDAGLRALQALGVEIEYAPELRDEALLARLANGGVSVLVVRSTTVSAEMLAAPDVSLVIRAGAGVNTIDIEAANSRGVIVSNCPGKNSHAVAELAFGLILACDRRIADGVADLRAGHWNKKEYSHARGLHGRTLGLVGMGNIAQLMIPIARAFGMSVAAYSRWMTAETAAALGIGRASTLEELAAMSDVVSVHVALTPETRGSIGESFFAETRPGFILVNTSRAEIVDQAALLRYAERGHVRAGLDVFEGEPAGGTGEYDGELQGAPGIYATHHIGASTQQAQESIAAEVVRIVNEYQRTGTAPNAVNVRRGGSASHVLIVRHVDRPGVLAHVLGILRDEGINVQEMENIVLAGARAAIAQVSLDSAPSEMALRAMKLYPDIFDASAFPIAAKPEPLADPMGL